MSTIKPTNQSRSFKIPRMSSSESTLFLVEHHVQDKEAFDEWFGEIMKSFQGKSFEELSNYKPWKGNKCVLTASSESGLEYFCLWRLPPDSTEAEFQTFIDDFTGGEPRVKNIVHKVQASMGLQNLNYEMYIKDTMKLTKEGSVYGFADDGELFFVHHNILNKEAWDGCFAEKLGAAKGKSTTMEITEAWEVGDGVKGVVWCGLSDEHAMCLWSMPKGSNDSDFQDMIDKFCGEVARNDVFKIEPNTCVGGRVLHPDFYTQEAVAYANSV